MTAGRWYLGAMNDGLFIIDRPPSPSGTDVPPGIYAHDPEMALPVWPLSEERARAIVDAHNAALDRVGEKVER
jgi:hypothetical protein